MNLVTFQTGCYEADWKIILSGNYLEKKIQSCSYPFYKKNLFINNVSDRHTVTEAAERLKKNKIIDNYYFSEDYYDEALAAFSLKRSDLGSIKQSYFSLYEFVGLYLCETPYLLSLKDDAYINKQSKKNRDWINILINGLNSNEKYVTANPRWSNKRVAGKEAKGLMSENKLFYLSHAFSDQCFLCKVAVFKGDIFRFEHSDSNRFPLYAGNSFERRINSFLNTSESYRLTAKNIKFIHCDFPKSKFKRNILAFFAKYFGFSATNNCNRFFNFISISHLKAVIVQILYKIKQNLL